MCEMAENREWFFWAIIVDSQSTFNGTVLLESCRKKKISNCVMRMLEWSDSSEQIEKHTYTCLLCSSWGTSTHFSTQKRTPKTHAPRQRYIGRLVGDVSSYSDLGVSTSSSCSSPANSSEHVLNNESNPTGLLATRRVKLAFDSG